MNENPEYAKLRAELREAEIALKDQRERVAELRRSLPADTGVPDHVFREATPDGTRDVRLSELFEDRDKTLILMHFMYGKKQALPCPMCTLWADGYDGIVRHLRQRVNFAVLVAGDPGLFAEFGRERGWRNVRIVSAGDSSFKRDVGLEGEDGEQMPGVSVLRLAADGGLTHFYTGGAFMGEGHFRGMDLLSPFWSFLDLTPEGRGDAMPSLRYG